MMSMKRDDFEQQVRTSLRRRPFRPFSIVLTTGTRFEVDAPEALAFDGGAAGYLNPNGEPFLFPCEDVLQTEASTPEPAS